MANPTGSKTKYAGSRSGPGTQKSPRVGRSSPPAMASPEKWSSPGSFGGEQNSAYAGRNPKQIGGESSAGFAADFFYRATHLTLR